MVISECPNHECGMDSKVFEPELELTVLMLLALQLHSGLGCNGVT
jgi:hypothetical protein